VTCEQTGAQECRTVTTSQNLTRACGCAKLTVQLRRGAILRGLPRGGAAVAGFLEQSAYPAESVPDPALGCAAHSTRGWGVAGDLLPEPARPSTGCVGGFDLTAASIRVFAVHARMEQVRAAHGPHQRRPASSATGCYRWRALGIGRFAWALAVDTEFWIGGRNRSPHSSPTGLNTCWWGRRSPECGWPNRSAVRSGLPASESVRSPSSG